MIKYITYDEAYKLYLDTEYYELMPFNSEFGPNFIEYLFSSGIEVIEYGSEYN